MKERIGTLIESVIMNEPSDTDTPNLRSAKEVIREFAFLVAYRVCRQEPENAPDIIALAKLLSTTFYNLFLAQSNELTRGDVFALFDTLAKIARVSEPAIAGPYHGTRKILQDEFVFEAFTPRGSAGFRHLKTGRVLYVAIEHDQLLLGMYEPSIDSLAAFVKPNDALAWVRGGTPGKRITNILWQLLP